MEAFVGIMILMGISHVFVCTGENIILFTKKVSVQLCHAPGFYKSGIIFIRLIIQLHSQLVLMDMIHFTESGNF